MNRTPQEAARLALACLDLTSLNDADTEADALVALQRMLDLPGKSHRD